MFYIAELFASGHKVEHLSLVIFQSPMPYPAFGLGLALFLLFTLTALLDILLLILENTNNSLCVDTKIYLYQLLIYIVGLDLHSWPCNRLTHMDPYKSLQ